MTRGRTFGALVAGLVLPVVATAQGANAKPDPGSPTAEREHGLPNKRHVHYRRTHMGKYFIGWLLGIPAIVLVILYLFFH